MENLKTFEEFNWKFWEKKKKPSKWGPEKQWWPDPKAHDIDEEKPKVKPKKKPAADKKWAEDRGY